MFQPEHPAYLQVSTGYAIPHSLPDYTFDETPLRLSDGRGSVAAGAGANAANALLYGTPLFSSANSAGVGPAPAVSASFNFHSTSSAAATTPTLSAPSHHRPSLPILLKMERNTDDLVAQEAAAREYQAQLEVNLIPHFPRSLPSLLEGSALTKALRYLQGPLVGKKTPSNVIVEEYAKADPIYVQKTMVRKIMFIRNAAYRPS